MFSLMAVGNVVPSGNDNLYMLCTIRGDTIDSVTLKVLSDISGIPNLIALPTHTTNYGSVSLTNSSTISLCPSEKLYTRSFLSRRFLEGDSVTLCLVTWVHF